MTEPVPSGVTKQRRLLKGIARTIAALSIATIQTRVHITRALATGLTKAVLVMSWAVGGGMGGRPALMQALDKTWRSRALCDMPMSAACWKMTDVGSREGFTWTPLKKTVSGPCLQELTHGHILTSGRTRIGMLATV